MKDLNYYMGLAYEISVKEFGKEDGGGIFLSIPLLGAAAVNAYGETYEEARSILEEVKRDYFETWIADNVPIPEPKGEDLQEYSGKMLLRMPRSLHKAVAEAAEEEGQSINAYIVGALLKTTERGEVAKEILETVCPRLEKAVRVTMFNYWSTNLLNPDHALEKQAARRGAEHPFWPAAQESSQIS